ISSVSTVENYEYGFFWYFYQDGNIGFEIKLTGILSLGAANPGEKPPFGTLVAPQVYAPNHQHFFNVRLDFDLDGTSNTVQQIDDTYVVFGYTFGHTHIPRPEDYPVMPTAYIGFLLKPNGFFDLNPANDVPSSEPAAKTAAGGCCH